jgi:hypothetical protein
MTYLKLFLGVLLCSALATTASAAWDPEAYTNEDVLEFYTVTEDGDEHWSKVWLVVLEGDVYIRLGGRAGDRIDGNSLKQHVKIRVAGEEFDQVLLEDASEQAEAVAAQMGEKYWSDIFIKYVDHPYTLRLKPTTE